MIINNRLCLESKPGDVSVRVYVFRFMPYSDGSIPQNWHRLVVSEDGGRVCATDSGGYDAVMVPVDLVMDALAHVRQIRESDDPIL